MKSTPRSYSVLVKVSPYVGDEARIPALRAPLHRFLEGLVIGDGNSDVSTCRQEKKRSSLSLRLRQSLALSAQEHGLATLTLGLRARALSPLLQACALRASPRRKGDAGAGDPSLRTQTAPGSPDEPRAGASTSQPRKHPGSVPVPTTTSGSLAFLRETKAFGSGPRGQGVSYPLGLHASPWPRSSLGEMFPRQRAGC